MEWEKNAQHGNACAQYDGRDFLQVVMMILAAFKKDGGGNMHKNPNDNREQLRGLLLQCGQ